MVLFKLQIFLDLIVALFKLIIVSFDKIFRRNGQCLQYQLGGMDNANQEKHLMHHLATVFIIVTPYLVRSFDGNLLTEGSSLIFFFKLRYRKVIGARYYLSGYEAEEDPITSVSFKSPRDSSGHGSHTASTAAGRYMTK